MYCAKCGNKIADDAEFCPNCGAKQTPDYKAPAPNNNPSFKSVNFGNLRQGKLKYAVIAAIICIGVIYAIYSSFNSPKNLIIGTWTTSKNDTTASLQFTKSNNIILKEDNESETFNYSVESKSSGKTLFVKFTKSGSTSSSDNAEFKIYFVDKNTVTITQIQNGKESSDAATFNREEN